MSESICVKVYVRVCVCRMREKESVCWMARGEDFLKRTEAIERKTIPVLVE